MDWYPFLENSTFFDLTCSYHSGCEISKLGALLEQMEKMLGKNEGRRRRGQQRMRRLDGIADSMNMSLSKLPEIVKDKVTKSWTRLIVWVNSESWWWTGRPGVLWFMGSQRVGHDWATELNWTIDWTTTWNIMKAIVINNNSTFPTTHVTTCFTSYAWKLQHNCHLLLEVFLIPPAESKFPLWTDRDFTHTFYGILSFSAQWCLYVHGFCLRLDSHDLEVLGLVWYMLSPRHLA